MEKTNKKLTEGITANKGNNRSDWIKTLYLGENGENCAATVGYRIKAYRNKFGYTQPALGKKLGGLAKNTISAYETGVYTPPLEHLITMCVSAGITLDEFFGLRPVDFVGDSGLDALLSYYETASPEAQEYILTMAKAVSKMDNKKNAKKNED